MSMRMPHKESRKMSLGTWARPGPDRGLRADDQRFRGLGAKGFGRLLRGSWDLVTRVIIKVTILIITYNPT